MTRMKVTITKVLILCCVLSSFLGAAQHQKASDTIASFFKKAYRYKNNANYDLAFKEVDKAKDFAEKNNDTLGVAQSYHMYASLYLKYQNDLNKIPDLLKTAESLLYELGDKRNLASNDRLWAEYYISKREFDKAENSLDDAESLFVKNGDPVLFKNTLKYVRGTLYLAKSDYAKAIEALKEAIPITDEYEQDFLLSSAYLNLAYAYRNLDSISKTETNVTKALNLASIGDFPKIKIEAFKIIGEIKKTQNDDVGALFYLEKHYSYKDSIFSIEKAQAVNKASNRSELDWKDDLLDIQQKEIEEKDDEAAKNQKTIILSSLLLIIISLLTISLYRNNIIKIKTNQLLLKKNSELQLAKDDAEAALQAKANFLSTVSHELRTPLYAVTGLTHLLLEEDPKEHQKEYLKSLKFSGDYLLALINDILQLNKIEAHKLSVHNEDINIYEILKEVTDSMAQTSKQNNNKIHVNIDKSIPQMLMGDKIKLSQILINLVGNALKFTKDGDIWVNLKTLEDEGKRINILFEIKDNGIGISEEKQKTIFESFSQGSKQINRKYGGTGLGLSIVKSLLSLVNSNINLKSELGKGSTFSFSIKFKKSEVQPKKKTPEIIIPTIPEPKNDAQYAGLHILLVEDNKINQMITKKMITKKNMTCDIANNGVEAIDLIKANHYELVLMDIHMPVMGGIEATQEIRKFNTALPIIALTAVAIDENMNEFMEVGFNDVISKPFRPEDFYRSVNNFLLQDL